MTAPLLEVDTLTAGYGDLVAVRDVSLAVRPAEVVTVLGTNGAGKTTLLGAIAGLVETMSGTVTVGGTSLDGRPAHWRTRQGVALVQENKRVFHSLTVDDNLVVATPRAARSELGDRRARAHELFPPLAEKAHVRAGDLSGGQQQMLAIGQALMADPDVLLLDEPSAGLAPRLVTELMDQVQRIAARGIGVLLVEQAVNEALRVASRVHLLRLGQLQELDDFDTQPRRELIEQLYVGTRPADRQMTTTRGE